MIPAVTIGSDPGIYQDGVGGEWWGEWGVVGWEGGVRLSKATIPRTEMCIPSLAQSVKALDIVCENN